MALTDEQILYNEALGIIGENEITEGTSTTEKNHALCIRFYERARDEVLAMHPWNEAITQSVVLEQTTMPLFDYSYKYALPSDCLRVLSIGSDTEDWQVQGSYIVTDFRKMPPEYNVGEYYEAGQYLSYSDVTYLVDTAFTASDWATDLAAYLTSQSDDYGYINLTYVKQLTDIDSFSARLRNAIAYKLAIKIVIPITQDRKAKVDLVNEFERIVMPQARGIDGMQGRLKPIYDSKWIRSRSS
jgi:hypothetical protein